MVARRACFWLLLFAIGCHLVTPLEPDEEAPTARKLWEQGQEALRQGRADEAIDYYRESLVVDPQLIRNYLGLASAFIEKKNEPEACKYLARYVEINPEQVAARARYGEVLAHLHRWKEAEQQLEHFVAGVQEDEGRLGDKLVQAHSRLVEVAEEADDPYAAHLHRGIGLFLLARKRAGLPDLEGELATEGLLCKAAAELVVARRQRPDEARPSLYLYEVWSLLGQRQPALCQLMRASAAEPFSYLTPTEHRDLHLAYQAHRLETQH